MMEEHSSLIQLFEKHEIRISVVEEFVKRGILSVEQLGRDWSLKEHHLAFAFQLENISKFNLIEAFEAATEEYFRVIPIEIPAHDDVASKVYYPSTYQSLRPSSRDEEEDQSLLRQLSPSSFKKSDSSITGCSLIYDETDARIAIYEREQMSLEDHFSCEKDQESVISTGITSFHGIDGDTDGIMIRLLLQTIQHLRNHVQSTMEKVEKLQTQIDSLKPFQLKAELQEIQMRKMQEEINQLKRHINTSLFNESEVNPPPHFSGADSYTTHSVCMTAVLPPSISVSKTPEEEVKTDKSKKTAAVPNSSSLSQYLQLNGFASDLCEKCEQMGLISPDALIEADAIVIQEVTQSLKAIPRKKFEAFLKAAKLGKMKEERQKDFNLHESIEETKMKEDPPLNDQFPPTPFDTRPLRNETNLTPTIDIDDEFVTENPITKRNSNLYPSLIFTKRNEVAEEYKARQEVALEEELQKWCKGNKLPSYLFDLLKEEKINSLHALLLAEQSVINKICELLKPIPARKLRIAYEQKDVFYDYSPEEEEEQENSEEEVSQFAESEEEEEET